MTTNLIAARMGLQFSWIEANLLGFFLADVRNWRGKFDEIKEEFTINPALIASQSSLNAGGSRWTRDLPWNSLNSLHEWIKSWEQRRRIHGFLKEKLTRFRGHLKRSWGADSWLCGSGSLGRCCGFNSPMNQLELRFKQTHDWGAIVARSRRDRGLIVRRLCVDHAADPRENTVWRSWSWFRNERSTIAARSRRDRGSIGPRSWSSSTKRLDRPMKRQKSGRSDRDPHGAHRSPGSRKIPTVRWFLFDASLINPRWRSDAPGGSTWQRVSRGSHPLNFDFPHVL